VAFSGKAGLGLQDLAQSDNEDYAPFWQLWPDALKRRNRRELYSLSGRIAGRIILTSMPPAPPAMPLQCDALVTGDTHLQRVGAGYLPSLPPERVDSALLQLGFSV